MNANEMESLGTKQVFFLKFHDKQIMLDQVRVGSGTHQVTISSLHFIHTRDFQASQDPESTGSHTRNLATSVVTCGVEFTPQMRTNSSFLFTPTIRRCMRMHSGDQVCLVYRTEGTAVVNCTNIGRATRPPSQATLQMNRKLCISRILAISSDTTGTRPSLQPFEPSCLRARSLHAGRQRRAVPQVAVTLPGGFRGPEQPCD